MVIACLNDAKPELIKCWTLTDLVVSTKWRELLRKICAQLTSKNQRATKLVILL